MSLDDKVLNERLVNLTVDGLETVYMASERISEGIFSQEGRIHARTFIREYDNCLMYQRPSVELRESFAHVAQILVKEAKSPAHELLNFVQLTCGGGAFYGLMASLYDNSAGRDYGSNALVAFIGFLGFSISRVMQSGLNSHEARRLHADAKRVDEAPDNIWSTALSMAYDKKFGRSYSD
jgi:hypothetical protein